MIKENKEVLKVMADQLKEKIKNIQADIINKPAVRHQWCVTELVRLKGLVNEIEYSIYIT